MLAKLARVRLPEWLALKPIISRQLRLNKAKTRFVITRLMEESEKIKARRRAGKIGGTQRSLNWKKRTFEGSDNRDLPLRDFDSSKRSSVCLKQPLDSSLQTDRESEKEKEKERTSSPLLPLQKKNKGNASTPLQPLQRVMTPALLQRCKSEEAKEIRTRKDFMSWIKDFSTPQGYANWGNLWGSRWNQNPEKCRRVLFSTIELVKEMKIRTTIIGSMADEWKRRP